MKEIDTEIEINASAEKVWRVMTNFAAYPDWNPFIHRVDGEVRVGARLYISSQPSGGKEISFRTTVLVAEPNRELRWHGQLWLPGLFEGVHSFLIEPLDEERVRFVHRERFRGLLVPLVSKILDRDIRRGFEEMNQALKVLSEPTT